MSCSCPSDDGGRFTGQFAASWVRSSMVLARQKECRIVEEHLMADHVHMCIERESAITMARLCGTERVHPRTGNSGGNRRTVLNQQPQTRTTRRSKEGSDPPLRRGPIIKPPSPRTRHRHLTHDYARQGVMLGRQRKHQRNAPKTNGASRYQIKKP